MKTSGVKDLEVLAAPKRPGKLWAAVVAFAAMIDYPMDDFQISIVVVTIKKRSVWHISAMRKIGKTHVIGFMILFLGSAGFTGMYTNHRAEFAKELFDHCRPYAEKLKRMGYVTRLEPSNGFFNIYFRANDAVAYFRTRSAEGLRGRMKMDYAFHDEAQKMKSAARKEISGGMVRSPLKLEVFMGNPATKEDFSRYYDSPFTQAKIAKRANFIEFSGAEAYDTSIKLTPELLLECNPNAVNLGDLEDLIRGELEDKSHEEVAAELFGIWNVPEEVERVDPEFKPAQLKKIFTRTISRADRWYLSVAIDYQSKEAFMVINDGLTMEVADVIELPHGSVEPVSKWILHNKVRFRRIFVMGTAKGKVLSDLLKSIRGKVEVVTPQSFAVSLARFLEQVEAGTLKVVESPDTKGALGSFWIGYDQKTMAPIARASTPEDVSLVMSLMMASIDEKAIKRIQRANGTAKVETPVEKVVVEEKKLDTMAAYLANKKAQAQK